MISYKKWLLLRNNFLVIPESPTWKKKCKHGYNILKTTKCSQTYAQLLTGGAFISEEVRDY